MIVQAESVSLSAQDYTSARVTFSLLLIFVGADPTVVAGAGVGIFGAMSMTRARYASAALGGGRLQAVVAEGVRRPVEDQPWTGARADD